VRRCGATLSYLTYRTMKILFIVLVALLPVICWSQPTLATHVAAQAKGAPATTAAVDTSSCTNHCMIGVCLTYYSVASGPHVSDNQGNTYTLLRSLLIPGHTASEIWVAFAPAVSATHTFTGGGTGPSGANAVTMGVMAFNGIAGTDQVPPGTQNSNGPSPISVGSIRPTNDNELILSCFGGPYATSASVASPMTLADFFPGGAPLGAMGSAYQNQTKATAVNPTWTFAAAPSSVEALAATFFSSQTPGTLNITTRSLPEGFQNVAYNFPLAATGGIRPYKFSLVAGTLPAGLSLNPDGTIAGTPSGPILETPLTFRITDATSLTADSAGLALTVAAAKPSITTSACPVGTQYQPYAGCKIVASGGTPPYTYSWSTSASYASLPEGLTLDSVTGIVSGSQIGGEGGYYTNVIVTDKEGGTANKVIIFEIKGDNSLGGCSLFPSNSIFHANVRTLPVDTSPAAPIPPVYAPAALRMGFGSQAGAGGPNGIPFIRVPYSQSLVSTTTYEYQDYFQNAPVLSGCNISPFCSGGAPIPSNAPVEGSPNHSPYPAYVGDGHVLVLQTAGGGSPCKLWEMYRGTQVSPPNWYVASSAYWNLASNTLTAGSTDAAGLPVTPLLLTYDEVAAAIADPVGHAIQHPTRFTLNHMLHYFVWPATNSAGVGSCTGGGTPSLGGRLSQTRPPASCSQSGPAGEIYRLKASTAAPPCMASSPQAKAIMTAFHNYGIILADNGISGYIIGTPDARWNDTDLSCLTKLHLSDFEPVNVSSIMVNTNSGQTKAPALPPTIAADGVVNAASFQPGIAANSWVTITGSNLASITDDWSNAIVNGMLPTVLDDVSVTIGGQPAYIYYVSPEQVNVLAPALGEGPVSVVVTNLGGVSDPVTTTASTYAPAFFTWPGQQVVATRQGFSIAAQTDTFAGVTTVPAKPGDVLILWANGFGPTTPAAPAGTAVPTDTTYATATAPSVTINSSPAIVFGAALSPNSAGLYQIAIQVPNTLADGDYPIQVIIGGVQSPAGTILSVRQ
jgi:uncharacterized protein (TIGR03437 family)